MTDRQTDGQRAKERPGKEAAGRKKMEVALWGRIWIRLSSGDPSSSRINALKFFVFTLNGFKETAEAVLWMPGAGSGTGKAAGWALGERAGEPGRALQPLH